MSTELLYTFLITCFLLIVTPGPDILYVVSQSISRGRKYGMAVVMGQMGGLVFHLSLFAFGISALITQSALLFKGVKWFGALYLIWLSYKIYKEDSTIEFSEGDEVEEGTTLLGFVKKGLLMNVLNPKVMMFFLALFPGFITEAAGNVQRQVVVLGGVFIAEAIVIFFVICSLAAQLTSYMRNNTTVHLFLKWLQIAVFSGLAILLVAS